MLNDTEMQQIIERLSYWVKKHPLYDGPEDLFDGATYKIENYQYNEEVGWSQQLIIYVDPQYADRRHKPVILSDVGREIVIDSFLHVVPERIKEIYISHFEKLVLLPLLDRLTPQYNAPKIVKTEKQFVSDIFVVMPFADEFKPIFDECIKPAAAALKLSARRADDFFSKHQILHEIIQAIIGCKVVIADCTGRNANVFYEIGFAHAYDKPVIMLANKSETQIPFDLNQFRRIEYQVTMSGPRVLRDNIRKALLDVLSIPMRDEDIPF